MIAVIADDLTGAAEIGGIALRYNLTVEVISDDNLSSHADVLVINTNTRSKSLEEAKAYTKSICDALYDLKPTMVFKKVDSVLRGHVAAEITEHLEAFKLKTALLIPANPILGRTISKGVYFIGNIEINKTSFADDPEFPVKQAHAEKMLGETVLPVHIQQVNAYLEKEGIIIGNVANESDLASWAEINPKNVLFAGSSGFFDAVMDRQMQNFTVGRKEHVNLNYPLIYVCGSTFDLSVALIKEVSLNGGPVSYMPKALMTDPFNQPDLINEWKSEILKWINAKGKVIIAVEDTEDKYPHPENIKAMIANVLEELFKEKQAKELIIEGGATANEVLDKLHIQKLLVVQEIAPGLTRSISDDKKINITLKPGSYAWTKDIWKF